MLKIFSFLIIPLFVVALSIFIWLAPMNIAIFAIIGVPALGVLYLLGNLSFLFFSDLLENKSND